MSPISTDTTSTDRVIDSGDLHGTLVIAATGQADAFGHQSTYVVSERDADNVLATIKFQTGPLKEAGINGVGIESLLAISADRLTAFQAGPFACASNQKALDAINEAIAALNERTRERMARNVEGTHQV